MSLANDDVRFLTSRDLSPSNVYRGDPNQKFLSLEDRESVRQDEDEWTYQTTLRIKEFGLLSQGWDSYGAPDIGHQAISRAIELVRTFASLPLRPFVAPTSEGGVEFEWSMGEHARLSVDIDEVGQIEVFYVLPDGREWSGSLGSEPDDLRGIYVELLEARPR